MPEPAFQLHSTDGMSFIDEGDPSGRPPIVLLHGMLGDLSNWTHTIKGLVTAGHRVVVPVLPVYAMPLKKTNVPALVAFVHRFLLELGMRKHVLIGNSLGGHVALLYALDHPEKVAALVLSGASGIYEVAAGTSTPKRNDRDFVQERTEHTFYDPAHATDELVDEMFEIINDRSRAFRLLKMARSTKEELVTNRLEDISAPTLLVWGRNDNITPPDVAATFQRRMPNAQLHLIDQCGHAPMMEHPEKFNRATVTFLRTVFERNGAAGASHSN